MAEHQVTLVANEGIFRGLAKQNMLFHECVSELIDNAIAARTEQQKFKIEIIFSRQNDELVDMFIADNCRGMSLEVFKRALQLGESATTDNRLNEHGFGMKNALATLSGNNGYWKIWTRPAGDKTVYTAEGPFGPHMSIIDDDNFPNDDFLPSDLSTLIKVPVRLSFIHSSFAMT